MAWKEAIYSDVRSAMQPGDVIAYGGKTDFSEIIKWVTRAPVSHLSIVVQSKLLLDSEPQKGFFNQVFEATGHGVNFARLSDHLSHYNGEIWWLPLKDEIRARMNFQQLYDFVLCQEYKPYDTPQAVKSALDSLDRTALSITKNVEDYTKFFCSELVAAALKTSGALPDINPSEVTPVDLCMFNIFREDYYQLKGDPSEIRGYNALDPTGWGV